MTDDLSLYRMRGTPYDVNRTAREYEQDGVTFSRAAMARRYDPGPHWRAEYENGSMTAVCAHGPAGSEAKKMYLVMDSEPDPAQPAHELFVRLITEDVGWDEVAGSDPVNQALEAYGCTTEQHARDEAGRAVQNVFTRGRN